MKIVLKQPDVSIKQQFIFICKHWIQHFELVNMVLKCLYICSNTLVN